MATPEQLARDLATQLTSTGINATATGAGVHWRVDLDAGTRSVVIHCFWYDIPARAGPEYLVVVRDGGVAVANGRTPTLANAVAAARIWARGEPLDVLVEDVPFVDARPRAMRAIARMIPSGPRWEIAPEPGCELWIYGDGRSCCARIDNSRTSWAFILGQAVVAHSGEPADIVDAISAWLVERVPIAAFAGRVPEARLEPDAEYLETDPARAHWLRVLARSDAPDDVLVPQRDLVRALAANPTASSFYSFTSLYRLCFSASSHYPWVDEGLPIVARAQDGRFVVDGEHLDLEGAVGAIERRLAAYPVRPFFGSEPHHLLPTLAAHLRGLGSPLVPTVVQQHAWFRLLVQTETRSCCVDGSSVEFRDGDAAIIVDYPSLELGAAAIRDFLDTGATFDAVATSHQAKKSYRR